jgi:DNA-binding IclR family transcriptional regulator
MDLIEEREKGRFVLSPQVLRLARAAEASFDHRAQVQPILARLTETTGETALYVRRLNDSAVCLAIAESDHQISISFEPGNLMPLHSGASAKLLLSALSPARLNQYFQRTGLPAAQRRRLEEDLATIRETGYAESAGEVDQGVWASAAGVHAGGVLVGALTVVAPEFRLSDEQKRTIAEAVRASAAEFEQVLAGGR